MIPVNSSNISAIGYDPELRTLTVRFKSGDAHCYEDVSHDHYHALMNADSVGKYFHLHIRNAHKARKA